MLVAILHITVWNIFTFSRASFIPPRGCVGSVSSSGCFGCGSTETRLETESGGCVVRRKKITLFKTRIKKCKKFLMWESRWSIVQDPDRALGSSFGQRYFDSTSLLTQVSNWIPANLMLGSPVMD